MTARLDLLVSLDLRQYSAADPGVERFRANVLSRSPLRRILEDGVSAGQIDEAYFASLAISAGGTTTLDVLGSLTNQIGETVSIAELVLVAVINLETATGSTISWGAHATTGPSGLGGAKAHRTRCQLARNAADPGLSLWYSPVGIPITTSTDDLDFDNDNADEAISSAYVLIAGRSS